LRNYLPIEFKLLQNSRIPPSQKGVFTFPRDGPYSIVTRSICVNKKKTAELVLVKDFVR